MPFIAAPLVVLHQKWLEPRSIVTLVCITRLNGEAKESKAAKRVERRGLTKEIFNRQHKETSKKLIKS